MCLLTDCTAGVLGASTLYRIPSPKSTPGLVHGVSYLSEGNDVENMDDEEHDKNNTDNEQEGMDMKMFTPICIKRAFENGINAIFSSLTPSKVKMKLFSSPSPTKKKRLEDTGRKDDKQCDDLKYQEEVTPNDSVPALDNLQFPVVRVGISSGRVENVFYLGEEGQKEWETEKLTNHFFHHPRQGAQMLCMRVAKDVPMMVVKGWVKEKMVEQGFMLEKIVLNFMGREVEDCESLVSDFPPLTLFLIHDGSVPEEFGRHRGKLIECMECIEKVCINFYLAC